jgi:hypothetical protein
VVSVAVWLKKKCCVEVPNGSAALEDLDSDVDSAIRENIKTSDK